MQNNKKRQIIKISMILGVLLLIVGVSFAFINLTLEGTKKQVITAGVLSLELDEDENNLTIENALPMYDEVGMIQEAFTFRLINDSTVAVDYILQLEQINTTNLSPTYVKYGLEKDGKATIDFVSNITDNVVDTGTIEANTTIEYALRLWIDSTVSDVTLVSGKTLSYRIGIEAEQINKDYREFVFHSNGGVGEDTTIICQYNEECDLTNISFTKENHTLVGWATSADGDLVYNTDLTLEDTSMNPGDTLDLYAVWSINYLYNYGEQYTSDTGGWTYENLFSSGGGMVNTGSGSLTTNSMYFVELGAAGSQYGSGRFSHSKLVNLTNAKTLKFSYTVSTVVPYNGNYPYIRIRVYDSNNEIVIFQFVSIYNVISTPTTYTLDVSNLNLSKSIVEVYFGSDYSGIQQFASNMYAVYATY